MDIVIPYRKSRTDELRYCLRSLKNILHGKVFVVGDRPDFISDKVIFIDNQERGENGQHDVELSMRLALKDERLSDDFILFNDDFFVMEKITNLPNYHAGEIADVIKSRKNPMFLKHNQGLKNTMEYLRDKNALSYELHVPMVMNKQKRLKISDNIINLLPKKLLLPRSIYGNLFCDISQIKKDVKLYNSDDEIPNDEFLSTIDNSFSGKVGDIIRGKFNNKCIYEKGVV